MESSGIFKLEPLYVLLKVIQGNQSGLLQLMSNEEKLQQEGVMGRSKSGILNLFDPNFKCLSMNRFKFEKSDLFAFRTNSNTLFQQAKVKFYPSLLRTLVLLKYLSHIPHNQSMRSRLYRLIRIKDLPSLVSNQKVCLSFQFKMTIL